MNFPITENWRRVSIESKRIDINGIRCSCSVRIQSTRANAWNIPPLSKADLWIVNEVKIEHDFVCESLSMVSPNKVIKHLNVRNKTCKTKGILFITKLNDTVIKNKTTRKTFSIVIHEYTYSGELFVFLSYFVYSNFICFLFNVSRVLYNVH